MISAQANKCFKAYKKDGRFATRIYKMKDNFHYQFLSNNGRIKKLKQYGGMSDEYWEEVEDWAMDAFKSITKYNGRGGYTPNWYLCEGQAPSDFCDGSSDCAEHPAFCECREAKDICDTLSQSSYGYYFD